MSVLECVKKTSEQKYMGEFFSEDGNRYMLVEGLREKIIPNWPKYYLPPSEAGKDALTQVEVQKRIKSIKAVQHFLQTHGFSFQNANILEFGCGYGVQAYLLADLGAGSVTGMDCPDYSVRQSNEMEMTQRNMETVSKWTEHYRRQAGQMFPALTRNKVRFVEKDIHCLEETERYDAIVSWFTLEHLYSPFAAFERVFKALKPGGISFHEYNPFFSMSGGHPFCTLDFHYGHCCLSASDFRRYITQFRPNEQKAALEFYEHNLNRMTYHDLISSVEKVGFQILFFIPWVTQGQLFQFNWTLLRQVQKQYPKVSQMDLMADIVWILLRKPA